MEIKFKVYIKSSKEILNVVLIDYTDEFITCYDMIGERKYDFDQIEFILYTNVKDNNKREVYNGDIYRQWCYPDYHDYTVEFEGGGFFLGDDLLIDVNWSDYEYIGNKFKK